MTRGIAANLEGKRFGHLIVQERTDSDKSGNAQWVCICDCGNLAVVRASFLQKGQIVCSRKCSLSPARQIKDIAGKTFAALKAIHHAGFQGKRKALWLFQCSCGNQITVPSDRVLNAGMKTCGKGIHASSYRHGLSKTRGYKSMHFMKYTANKKNQTPKWLTKSDIDEMTAIYIKASEMTRETGIIYEVDHFYPLQGKKVSGLHVPANLRIVTRSENRKKINRLPDDVC